MEELTSEGRHIIRIEKSALKQAIPVLNKTCFAYTSLKLRFKMSWHLRYENATPNLCWVSCAINKGGFFEIAFSSSTHICLALRRLLKFCLTLTR